LIHSTTSQKDLKPPPRFAQKVGWGRRTHTSTAKGFFKGATCLLSGPLLESKGTWPEVGNACMSRVRGGCCGSTRQLQVVHNRSTRTAGAAIMENRPPHNLARRSSLMHSKHPSKSSPAKRDPTRVLAPQYNQAVAPTTDAFDTGLLTPQASQNTFDSDAAMSLISPPPEDGARVGISRQSVRGCVSCLCSH
jgi:hypothetical protein